MPLIVRWPGRIKPGTSDELVCLVDTLATCAALTGKSLPADAGPDSFNLLPILPFDGGHIALNVVERFRGKRMNAKVFERMVAFGTVLLVMLFIFLTFNDVRHLFGG